MCVLTIVGKAFLWHQIRCIVAVLFRVGSGLEAPDVINELVSKCLKMHPDPPIDSMFIILVSVAILAEADNSVSLTVS